MTQSADRTQFREVSSTVSYPELEEKILAFWQEKDVFRRSMEEREGGPEYVFFEGPPTANGRPGIHHVLARSFKDMFPRYKTMQGFHVLRKGGWDTHGLPVELEVEKQLGLTGKDQIEAYGVAAFNQKCKESVWNYLEEWSALTERMAFWVDLEDPYVTMHNTYIESLWWILNQFWEKGLLYQGYKVVPYCPRCGTPLSSHELSLGYKEGTVDPSVYVKFAVQGEEGSYFLAWTTTPWTLPGNAALAVGEKLDYVQVRDGNGDLLYLAKDLVEAVVGEGVEVVAEMKGADLLGKRYEPLYRFMQVDEEYAFVVAGEFVSTEDGTGIVHIAPAFGADDMEVGRREGLPVIHTVDAAGRFKAEVEPWAGQFVKDADPHIEAELESRGLLYRSGTYEHTYPFCWRCDTPLIYWAKESWFVRTSDYRDRLVALNQEINWEPDHVKNGRFGRWLENNVDWALGRDRYWATPIPIWKSDKPGSNHMECVGSLEELAEKAGRPLGDLELHRPYVDEITWPAPDGGTMRRVDEVCDVWFDSGAMPLAQWHYPFENQEKWETYQQADFICEAVDQTRGWFYTLHAVSTLLFDRPAFKNVICLGLILAEDGSKMSKSKGNIVSPWDVFAEHGVDATRWYMYTAGPPGNARRFSSSLVGEVVRRFLNTLWNTYSFFLTYANLSPDWDVADGVADEPENLLDRWLLSELNQLVQTVTEGYESYDVIQATRPVAEFVDQMSNWYVRLNRRRFWDGDPGALQTLHHTLVTLSKLLAPATPYIAEEIYGNLVANVDESVPDSVHLARWPEVEERRIDTELHEDMALVQKVTTLGRAAREAAGLKIRQPLQQVIVETREREESERLARTESYLLSELNVKELSFGVAEDLVDVEIHPLPRQLGQKFGRDFPRIRQALAGMDQRELATRFGAGESVTLDIEGDAFTIEPGDVEVRTAPREGFSTAADGGYLVAVTTELSPALLLEGQSREVVRRVQQLRKDAGFEISDRIVLYVVNTPLMDGLMDEHGAYLREETLTVEVVEIDPQAGVPMPAHLDTTSFVLGEDEVVVGLERAS